MHFNVWVSPHIKPLNKLMNQAMEFMEFSHPQHILKTFSIVHKIIRKHFDGPRCENQFRFGVLGKILGRLTGEILYPFQYRHLIKIMF